MTIQKPGLYYNIRFEDYQKIDAVNNSVLKILADERQCPAHALEYLEHGRKDTPALVFGRALDCYLLEPTRFVELYEVEPIVDRRSKIGKLEWEHFQQQLGKKESVSQENYEKIIAIYNKVIGSQAMRLIQGGKSQVVAVWIDGETKL
ncbi:PD-(D/E)XK nuclease-like domain-containing protein, partial [Candidatus Bathyarchaeota archaeon]|nr:PD-(D/E)XK nuclease-like domain-containing protein [Candidatus Bathyarchaeota archaeon]